MKQSRLINIIYWPSFLKKTAFLWYKQIKDDRETFNILETKVHHRKSFQNTVKEMTLPLRKG